MKSKIVTSAALRFRNIAVLLVLLAVGSNLEMIDGMLSFITPVYYYPAVFAVYTAMVIQTLYSKSFHDKFNRNEKMKEIKRLNYECIELANRCRKTIASGLVPKLKKVMDDRKEITKPFFEAKDRGVIKERIVEQTLQLVASYIKLLANYSARMQEVSNTDVSEVVNRINMNRRKLNFSRDALEAGDLKNIIEIDEKIISRVKEEKVELEKISTKLTYIEGTISLFKHQALTSVGSEDMLEKLDSAVNEAIALDSVLEDRKKNRMRL